MTTIRLQGAVRKQLETMVLSGYPHETCGVLIGTRDGTERKIFHALQGRNIVQERAHDRYELDPRDFLAADLKAREEGLDIIGFWHSHPANPAIPSETDRKAAWEGYSYLILSVNPEGISDIRCWRLAGSEFIEEEIRS